MKIINNYEEAVAYLLEIPKFTKKNTMEDTKRFLKELYLPLKYKKIIHVAGTNGKGSVCCYLNQLLLGAKKKTAMFTSPHIVDIRERIQINGEMVSKDAFFHAFLTVYEKIMLAKEENKFSYHPTFFEFLFFMAMVLFCEEEMEYIILETGLGGMLDATNSIEEKELAIITRIGLDHTEYLGNTIEQVAKQKAGILRKKTKTLYFADYRESAEVIEQCAEQKKAVLYPVGQKKWKEINFRNKNIDFSYNSRYYDYIAVTVSGIAIYQVENVSMALTALEMLLSEEEMPSVETIKQVIEQTIWQGRMEEVLPNVFLDGAHNVNGIEAFLKSVKQIDGVKKTLLFTVVADKDYKQMIKMITDSHLFDKIFITELKNNYRALKMQEILQEFLKCGRKDIIVIDNVKDAIRTVVSRREEKEHIFVAGSLYLVGRIKEIIGRDQND